MTTTKGLKTKMVRELLLDALDRAPATKNPYLAGTTSCAYSQPDPMGRPSKTRHCVVGRLAANLGWAFPEEREGSSPAAADAANQEDWPITPRAARFLSQVQMLADGTDRDAEVGTTDRRRTWGEVATLIREGHLTP